MCACSNTESVGMIEKELLSYAYQIGVLNCNIHEKVILWDFLGLYREITKKPNYKILTFPRLHSLVTMQILFLVYF